MSDDLTTLKDELESLHKKEQRLSEIAAAYEETLDSFSEEEKEAELELRAVFRVSGGTIAEGTEGSLVISQERAVESEEEVRFLPDNAIGTLEQLTTLLFAFYQTDLLHQIRSLNISPTGSFGLSIRPT